MAKCKLPEGLSVRPDGVNELDPCIYQEVQTFRNVTVHILRCKRCGHMEISWERQEDTEEVDNVHDL